MKHYVNFFMAVLLAAALPFRGSASDVTVQLPNFFKTGPINVVCDEDTGECPILAIAWIGDFASVAEMRASAFYPMLIDAYPDLANVTEISVDTGEGGLWLLQPQQPNISVAINEYNIDMYNGVRDESSGAVLYRTEYAEPMLLRMTAQNPGQMRIVAVDNDNVIVRWVPSLTTDTLSMLLVPHVESNTIDACDLAELGRNYVCYGKNNSKATLCFYGNGIVRINGKLGKYRNYIIGTGNGIGFCIWLCDASGRQTSAFCFPDASNTRLRLDFIDGYDLGLGTKSATFVLP